MLFIGNLFSFNTFKKFVNSFSDPSPKTLGKFLEAKSSLKDISFDDSQIRNLEPFLFNIAIGFSSCILILIVFGYFFLP